MVQLTNNAEWETDPDYALLAVTRVVLQHVCYQNAGQETDADYLLQVRIDELTGELDEVCNRS